ncbi:Glycosyltransferase, DXD sugar-binding motif [uncultured Caudovirales phage]|uniref:Glycosyltransferase, DXD sugar-binding motif n=1 Tax=uncultured Caudovirales phage TaxID=2100421 RepID=A0A6J5LV01_9CAUD|nr:Glycosyltransferase, DXD sugar-binding motif [uncultured Caudovirales phage]
MIPRTMNLVWLNPPVPVVFVRLLLRFADYHPDWKICVWHSGNTPALLNGDLVSRIRGNSFKSDIVRYEIMARYGGWYMDWDMVWIDSIDNWFDCDNADNVFTNDAKWCHGLNNCFYGVSPTNPIAWALVNRLAESIRKHADPLDGGQAEQSGVKYFSRVVRSFPERAVVTPAQLVNGYTPDYWRNIKSLVKTKIPALAMHFFNSCQTTPTIEQAIGSGDIWAPEYTQEIVDSLPPNVIDHGLREVLPSISWRN